MSKQPNDRNFEIVFTPLGPLQGVFYEQTGNRITKKGYIAAIWALPAFFAAVNGAPYGFLAFSLAAAWELFSGTNDEKDFDEADELIEAAERRLGILPSAEPGQTAEIDEKVMYSDPGYIAFMKEKYGSTWQPPKPESPGTYTQLHAIDVPAQSVLPAPSESPSAGLNWQQREEMRRHAEERAQRAQRARRAQREYDDVAPYELDQRTYSDVVPYEPAQRKYSGPERQEPVQRPQRTYSGPERQGGRAISAAQKTALTCLLESPLANRAFIGSQRTGKSGLVAVAGKLLTQKGYTFYQINLASYSDGHSEDDDYTKHIHPANSVRGDIATIRDKEAVHQLVDRATSLVHDWFATKNSILIVDEWFSLASQSVDYASVTYPLAQLIAGKLAHLTSAGTKRGLALWLVTPQCKAGGMSEAGKEIKQCKLCYVAIAPNKAIKWSNNRITWDAELFEYVRKNFPIEHPNRSAIQGEDRIAYVNGDWFPLGTTASHFQEMKAAQKAMPKPQLNGEQSDDIEVDLSGFDVDETFDIESLFEEPSPFSVTEINIKIEQLKKQTDSRCLCLADLLKAIRNRGLTTSKITVDDVSRFNWSKVWNDGSKGEILVKSRNLEGYSKWLRAVAKLGFLELTDNEEEFIITLS